MKLILRSDTFAVFDDALPAAQFAALNHYVLHDVPLRPVHSAGYQKVWHFLDGTPFTSPQIMTEVVSTGNRSRTRGDARLGGPDVYGYPSGCPVDSVVALLLRRAARFSGWTGVAGTDWHTLAASVFAYPQGTGLDWHSDADHYSGAFTLYAHKEWQPPWGGELLLSTDLVSPDRWQECGTFVTPRPNRLVLLRAGTLHKVHRVTPRAGDRTRYAVSGFFDRRRIDDIFEFAG
jgi:hypothetical protein